MGTASRNKGVSGMRAILAIGGSMPMALRRLFLGLAICIVGAFAAAPSRATILGLDDGSYDVTLFCRFDCGLGFNGTLNVAGDDVTDWFFTFPPALYGNPGAETFSGNPDEFVNVLTGFESIRGGTDNSPHELGMFYGFSATWGISNGGLQVINGNWIAVRQDVAVPEPLPVIMLLFGLAALGVHRIVGPSTRRSVGLH